MTNLRDGGIGAKMTNPGNNYDEELGKNVPQRFRAMLTNKYV